MIDTKQILESFIIKLKLPIKKRRHNNLLFKKNNDNRYKYLFSLKKEESDQWFEANEEELVRSSIKSAWREPEYSSQLLKRVYKLEQIVEDAIQ